MSQCLARRCKIKLLKLIVVVTLVVMVAGIVLGTSCGTQGPTGPKGDTGATGATGPAGQNGTNGANGATWHYGTSAPSSDTGAVNDWYINTTTDDLYCKTGTSTWTLEINIKGVTGAQGVQGPPGLGYSPMQIALLRWYEAIQTGNAFSVGSSPFGIAFDGANIWVTNLGSNSVTKLKASDGSLVGAYSVGSYPLGIAFDGANIWVANYISNSVSKL